MSIAEGTPTVLDQLKAGWDALTGKETPTDATVLAGVKADADKALGDIEGLLGPVFSELKSDVAGDLGGFLQGVLTLIPSITSLSGAVNVVKAVASAEVNDVNTQVLALSHGALTTLVSAAAVAVGKTSLT